jgi:hypothetical protein
MTVPPVTEQMNSLATKCTVAAQHCARLNSGCVSFRVAREMAT